MKVGSVVSASAEMRRSAAALTTCHAVTGCRPRFERAAPGDHGQRVAAADGWREKCDDRPMKEALTLVELHGVRSWGGRDLVHRVESPRWRESLPQKPGPTICARLIRLHL
jgi:hypothetical protein